MNTKFEELANEIGIKDIGGLYGGEFIGAIRPEYLEQFAESIIRECMNKCYTEDGERIRNHFGLGVE